MRRLIATGLLVFVLVNLEFVNCSAAEEPAVAGRKIVSRANPLYPELARRMQIQGTVKVEATVAPSGKVKSTKVIGGSPVLTKAAVNAIETWKWAAGTGETTELIELTFHP